MYGVMTPGRSTGSNHPGTSVVWTPQVIWPWGAALAGHGATDTSEATTASTVAQEANEGRRRRIIDDPSRRFRGIAIRRMSAPNPAGVKTYDPNRRGARRADCRGIDVRVDIMDRAR